jgi:REP element-mobilizing transposase RayT
MSAIAYFISFHTYGSWLHGRDVGSVDHEHNSYGTPFVPTDAERELYSSEKMTQPRYELDAARREVVLASLKQHASFRGWDLYAVHVRSNHVHIVVSCTKTPEQAMNEFKAYTSRALNCSGFEESSRKRWSRHGSTRHLFDTTSLFAAIRYTIDEQGPPMSVYENNAIIVDEPRL